MKKILALLVFLLFVVTNSYAQKESSGIETLNMKSFKEKVSSGLTPSTWKFVGKRAVVVDFYASWCAPCKKLAPIMEQMAKRYKDKVDFYKVDVDKAPGLSQAFEVSSVPTLLFIPLDGAAELVEGAPSREELENLIEYLLFDSEQ